MAVICPTVTAFDTHEYRFQMERLEPFAQRLHVDFMDGVFAPTNSPPLDQVWFPDNIIIDLHLMYKRPSEYLHQVLAYKPSLVIVHAEAEGNFIEIASQLHKANIKTGVALLPESPPDLIAPALEYINHVLIFSGELGHFGGQVNLSLLEKVKLLKSLKQELEIGWDGGINNTNINTLIHNGIDVLNVGGYIQKSKDPAQAYATLEAATKNRYEKTDT
jgi:ribulose-phosphate 3-epimerase